MTGPVYYSEQQVRTYAGSMRPQWEGHRVWTDLVFQNPQSRYTSFSITENPASFVSQGLPNFITKDTRPGLWARSRGYKLDWNA